MGLSDNTRGAVIMTGSMAAFVLNDACMKAVTETVPTFPAAVLRGCITVAMLCLIAQLRGGIRLRFPRRQGGLIAIRCAAEAVSTACFLLALKHMPLANITAVLQALPLAVTLGAAVVFGERIGWRRAVAVTIGLIGVLVIIRPGSSGFNGWSLLALASMVAVVARDLATRGLSREVPSFSVAIYSAAAVTLFSACAIPFEGGWPSFGLSEVLGIVIAALALVAGYLCAVAAMRVGEVGAVAPFRYTALVFAVALGWLVFGQLPDAPTWLGAAIVVGASAFTLYRQRRLAARGQAPVS